MKWRKCKYCGCTIVCRRNGTLVPHGQMTSTGGYVDRCPGENRAEYLSEEEADEFYRLHPRSMGSYARDCPERHFGMMSSGTCAVCGQTMYFVPSLSLMITAPRK